MRRVLVDPVTDKNQTLFLLSDDEVHHLTQVLRLRAGETIECLDGNGQFFNGELNLLGKGKGQIQRKGDFGKDPSRMASPVTLEIACLKGDAMDWTIEKSVELGVRTLVPLLTDHTVVQMGRKTPEEFRARWQKIADQTLKQCGRLEKMTVAAPVSLAENFQAEPTANRLWAFENERRLSLESALDARKGEAVRLLIGPEGGWSANEITFLATAPTTCVSLGPWIYRAETAALVATSLCVSSMRRLQ